MSGPQYGATRGSYGTLGVASPTNLPGPRSGGVSWTDHQGRFWTFGGFGEDAQSQSGSLNDLWMFNPSTNSWIWEAGGNSVQQVGVYGTKGMAAAGNTPGARVGAANWTDAIGNLWLFGGKGLDSAGTGGTLNDLWEFSPTTEQWTWIAGNSTVPKCSSGSSCGWSGTYGSQGSASTNNLPGARSGSVSWIDQSGNVWLFGGGGFDANGNSGSLNDLWEFNPATLTWTWVNGSNAIPSCGSPNSCGSAGVYGTRGTPSVASQPGGRGGSFGAIDNVGNLWLFGGSGFDSLGSLGMLNDLWMYNASLSQWVWMGGSASVGSCSTPPLCGNPGVYGTFQTAGAANTPGGRMNGASWTDSNGNFWLFGGVALDQNGTYGRTNDLWVYSQTLEMWTWMGGAATTNQVGVYGTLGMASPSNSPGSRSQSVSWTDSQGNLWLFGGVGNNASGGPSDLNDLWLYQPSVNVLPVAATPTFSPSGGTYSTIQNVAILDATPNSTIYYTTDGTTPNAATSTRYASPLQVSTTETIQAIATASGFHSSAIGSVTYTINLPAAAAPVFSVSAGTYSTAQTLVITAATPGSMIYYTIDGTAPSAASIPYASPITIAATETIRAIAVASGYASSTITSAAYIIWPPLPVPDSWTWMKGSQQTQTPAVFGTQGILAPGNTPGTRSNEVTWKDTSGNLWLFGGYGCTASCTGARLNDLWEFVLSSNQWRWVGGTQAASQAGIYGTLGTPSASNIPGARERAVSWTDSKGRLWLFGGDGYDANDRWSNLNDLWVFDPSTTNWTWMGGSNAPSSCITTWGESGGYCGASGAYGTLGKADSANIPGSRYDAVSWTDSSGNLWMFGGTGRDSVGNPGILNDLWKYDTSINQWAWMGGSNTIPTSCAFGIPPGGCAVGGLYGTLGASGAANAPGARSGASAWTDRNGNLWLFGGYGYDANAEAAWLNDLWEYDIAQGQWKWVSGSAADRATGGRPTGVYGSWRSPAVTNIPGGRQYANAWTDTNGNLWLFGGNGFDTFPNIGYLNDLWMFNPQTSMWTWMAGSTTTNSALGSPYGQPAVWGLLQTPSILNEPGGQSGGGAWTDSQGNFWLYGGRGYDDLWVYQPTTTAVSAAGAPSFSPPSGSISAGQAVALSDSTPGASVYYMINGMASPALYAKPIVFSSSISISAIAVAPGYANSTATQATYTIVSAAAPTFSLPAGEYASPQTLSISDQTPNAVIYYTLDGTQPTTSSSPYSGAITVSRSETIRAIAIAPGSQASQIASSTYTIWSGSSTNDWAWMGGGNPSTNTIGLWGTLGVQSFDNIPSGRYRPATWTDQNGNLWLFGGFGYDANDRSSYLDDLWEFTPSSNQWTWMGGPPAAPLCWAQYCGQPGIYGQQGTAAPTNVPGARYGSSSWTDAAGRLWLFGGLGFDANSTNSELNDLWSFQPSTNQWTWMSGSNTATGCLSIPLEFAVCSGAPPTFGTQNVPSSANNPGAREGANTWVDSSGNVWLFGGKTYYVDASKSYAADYYLNDLWKLNPSTNQWTWVSGNNQFSGSACYGNANSYLPTCGHAGVYGSLGAAGALNTPGARRGATTWIDANGNLWLFGGYGYDASASVGQMHDMWEFIPSSGQWIWKGGANIAAACDGALFYDICGADATAGGVYGTKGVPAVGNIPQYTSEAAGWTDKNGNLWLFSGGFSDALWEYSPSANEWTWISGTNGSSLISEVYPVFGIRGTPSPGNSPGGRRGTATWTDKDGSFWLFGGNSAPFVSLTAIVASDLWKFQATAPPAVPSFSLTASVSSLSIAAGSNSSASIVAMTGGGFNSSITLSATGQPAGMTVSFSPPSISGAGSSNMTISTTSSTPAGSYTITISGSSGTLTQGTTIALVIAPPPPTFTLSESLSSLTVAHGGSGTITLTITPQFGFNSAVTFACSGLPTGASCSFTPAAVTPAGGSATTVATISVPVTTAAASTPAPGKLISIAVLCFTLLFFPLRRRPGLRRMYFVFALIVAGLISSCGGGGVSGSGGGTGSTPHSYAVTFTATSGAIQQVGTLTLTVN